MAPDSVTQKQYTKTFSNNILKWFDIYGRKNLPWQQNVNAYRVWISEIMLQQTQVATVIPYFHRFMEAFPTINLLANAEQDQVLHLWSGLGYYSRARNLHKSAQIILDQHNGELPDDVELLETLPGIGRSTAGAICAQAYKTRAPILDGNVKRVLARHEGISGWPGQTSVSKKLWIAAEQYTPDVRVNHYTQAIMDLGATVCTRTKPDCTICPINKKCYAYNNDSIQSLPGKKPKKTLPTKNTTMLIVQNANNQVLLEKRPSSGIWGGLWSLPEQMPSFLATQLSRQEHSLELPSLKHTFSHFHLNIQPVHYKIEAFSNIMEENRYIWYNLHDSQSIGLATPVSKLLQTIKQSTIDINVLQPNINPKQTDLLET